MDIGKMDLKWLDLLTDRFPKKSRVRRNLIEIAGYPSWENVNSNLLAFYFDKTEEHGFGTLFIDSLIELLPEHSDGITPETEFVVSREVRTDKGKRIDLVLRQLTSESGNDVLSDDDEVQSDWAVIIENKIHHFLRNDLKDYWNSTRATHKVGIVLSRYRADFPEKVRLDLEKSGIHYHHVSHREFMDKVQEKLFQCFPGTDDRHLLYLKEFIANTHSYYNFENMDKDNEQLLSLFQEHEKNISALKEHDHQLLKFVSTVVFAVFRENGFEPNSGAITKGKHFYPAESNPLDGNVFRFFVDLNSLRYRNTLYAYFELHGKAHTCYGSKTKELLQSKGLFTREVQPGTGGNDKASYNHLYGLTLPIGDFTAGSYRDAFREAMKTHFWNHASSFLDEARQAYSQASNAAAV